MEPALKVPTATSDPKDEKGIDPKVETVGDAGSSLETAKRLFNSSPNAAGAEEQTQRRCISTSDVCWPSMLGSRPKREYRYYVD